MDAQYSNVIDMVLCGDANCCFSSGMSFGSVLLHAVLRISYASFILHILVDEVKSKKPKARALVRWLECLILYS